MEVTMRTICLVHRNHATKLYGSRIIFRFLRGTRLTIPKKISRENERALDNIMCATDGKHPALSKTDRPTLQDEIDYLRKYEIGDEIASFYKKREKQQNFEEKCSLKPKPNKSPSRISTPQNQYDLLSEKVSPLYKLPYKKQLQTKYKWTSHLLKNIGRYLKTMANLHVGSDSLPCPLSLVVPSPMIENYRNKDEFSIHNGIDGNPKTVGFFLDDGSEDSDTVCVNIDQVVMIRDEHKSVAKDFENYIRQSPLPPQCRFSEDGYWKNIVIRSNEKKDVMVIVIMHPQNLSEEQLEAEKDKLKEYFTSKDRKGYNLMSLYFQACRHTKCTHAVAPFELLYGEPYIYESLNGFQFQISPEPFFQTNTAATEGLLKAILKRCKFNPSTVLLDICCGSGAMGICFSPYVKKTIGIDISSEGIKDAKANAKLNNVENAEFHCGTTEKLLPDILNDIYADDLIAIVNPPRQGLSTTALLTLRQCKYLKKIIYVSCKPEASVQNYTELCRSHLKGVNIGKPFLPMIAIPVDMFPQTKHTELVILFQRL